MLKRLTLVAAALIVALLSPPSALALDAGAIERDLAVTVDGKEEHLDLDEAMRRLNIPSVSLAVIEEGRIAFAKAYGGDATPETLYQAASLSKFVAAIGAMRLVEQGMLDLDQDVNAKLTSWRVPANEFDAEHKVTLRGLLSMTGGIGVPGFIGYDPGAPLPTLTQILDGAPPANSPKVTVIAVPGSGFRYSGGGYEIAEALMQDATGKAFPNLMQELVLEPAGMTRSTFAQPLPAVLQADAASGHFGDGRELPGRWRVCPEHAAAGLWSTPTDIAKLLVRLAESWHGFSSILLRRETLAGDAYPPEWRSVRARRGDCRRRRVARLDEAGPECRLPGLSDPLPGYGSGHGGDDGIRQRLDARREPHRPGGESLWLAGTRPAAPGLSTSPPSLPSQCLPTLGTASRLAEGGSGRNRCLHGFALARLPRSFSLPSPPVEAAEKTFQDSFSTMPASSSRRT